jgi:UDP-3-O-[3-hydroxymyristoyl] glucosamine N-acyltransferase
LNQSHWEESYKYLLIFLKKEVFVDPLFWLKNFLFSGLQIPYESGIESKKHSINRLLESPCFQDRILGTIAKERSLCRFTVVKKAPPPMTLSEKQAMTPSLLSLNYLASELDLAFEGNGDLEVGAVTHPRLAQAATDLIYLPDTAALTRYAEGVTKARGQSLSKVVLTDSEAVIPESLRQLDMGFLRSPRSRYTLALLTQRFDKPAYLSEGIHPTALIDPTATLGEGVQVGAYAVIGPHTQVGAHTKVYPQVVIGAQVQVGADCLLHAGVHLGDRVRLGNRVIVQPNAVVGSDGFSFVTKELSAHESAKQQSGAIQVETQHIARIQSLGTVVIEDDVEIGAGTCLDRGTLGETRIGRGTKLDNLVQIGHNNTVGQDCLIVAQVGLSGSCQVGNRVVIAGQSGIADHLQVGDDAIIMARSGVMKPVDPKTVVGGSPALPRREALEQLAYTAKLKSMNQTLKKLQQRLESLEARLAASDASVTSVACE